MVGFGLAAPTVLTVAKTKTNNSSAHMILLVLIMQNSPVKCNTLIFA